MEWIIPPGAKGRVNFPRTASIGQELSFSSARKMASGELPLRYREVEFSSVIPKVSRRGIKKATAFAEIDEASHQSDAWAMASFSAT